MKEDKEKVWYDDIIRNCPMLYTGCNKTIQESLMPFGFECGKGWYEPLAKLSYSLETLNMTYWPKYKTRIEAVQVKEKFGTLHFYYDVHIDGCLFLKKMSSIAQWLESKLGKFKYEMKRVVDKPASTTTEKTELTKVEYVKAKYSYKNCSNVKVFEADGKYWKEGTYDEYEQAHYEPTRHKILYWIKNKAHKLTYTLENVSYREHSREQIVISNYMHELANQYIRIAEDECAKVCEDCGQPIGSKWSPICQTTGWITYICSDCAEKTNREYYKNEEVWCGKKRIKTKAQVIAQHKKAEANSKKMSKKWDKERAEYEAELKKAEAEEKKAKKTKTK